MPSIHCELAGDKRGTGVDAVVEDFQQVGSILSRQSRQTPVIQLRYA
jgi:hypothetical protein